jgi:GTP-binding protein
MRAIERAEIAIILIDAAAGITAQDAHVAGYVHEAAKGAVLGLNKWDLVERSPDSGAEHLAAVRRDLQFLDYAGRGFPLSAHRPERRSSARRRARRARTSATAASPRRRSTSFFRMAISTHPVNDRGKQLKLLYATQASVRPPTFVLFVNDPGDGPLLLPPLSGEPDPTAVRVRGDRNTDRAAAGGGSRRRQASGGFAR